MTTATVPSKALYQRLEETLGDAFDFGDNPKIQALLLDVAALETATAELVDASDTFAMMAAFLSAMSEQGAFKNPLTEHSTTFGLQFGGGSHTLYVGDFYKILEATRKAEACLV